MHFMWFALINIKISIKVANWYSWKISLIHMRVWWINYNDLFIADKGGGVEAAPESSGTQKPTSPEVFKLLVLAVVISLKAVKLCWTVILLPFSYHAYHRTDFTKDLNPYRSMETVSTVVNTGVQWADLDVQVDVHVQNFLLIIFQYDPISLQYSWLSVEQPIRFWLSVV